MRKKYQLNEKNRRIFLEGLQRYQDRGVIIRIDGEEAQAPEWIRILEEQPDGSFYMGDYVMDDREEGEENLDAGDEERRLVRESNVAYEAISGENSVQGIEGGYREKETSGRAAQTLGPLGGRMLKEIRFDRVYHQ